MQRTRVRGEDAQALVEFALFAMIALFLLLGTVDFSRFMYFDTAINSAARIGAEAASNHCTPYCGALTVTTEDFVAQAVACEGNIGLKPQPAQGCGGCQSMTGAPGGCNDPYNSSSTTYNATAPSLSQDIYITPAYAPNGGASLPTTPTIVTVEVGYNFTPVTPLISTFFPVKTCYPGDPSSNHHTLCATAQGKIAT